MAENRLYLAVGEETARGSAESAAVGFVPLSSPSIPKMEFDDRTRKEYRGEAGALGDTTVARMSRKWSASIAMPFFTEAGSVKGVVGTLVKHFFGSATSAQNGTTGQYAHMMYPVSDPFATANLGAKAVTLNLNINEGAAMRNWPFVGGRVRGVSFEQETGHPLRLNVEMFGQTKAETGAEIGLPVFAAENLRCDYNGLKVYTGTITRTGTAPDYTGFSFAGATQLKPDKVSVKMENGMEDALRLGGDDYPDKTRMGRFKVSVDITIDWEDPASGFSSIAEWRNWMGSASSTNFCLVWDTLTQAGTGDNHSLDDYA
ncbi:MAG: hypothetical protein HY886_07185 [Deltaproteobacteria bacterium]|nr:hypothetical protein [Deltaproteobacteria bacterium]